MKLMLKSGLLAAMMIALVGTAHAVVNPGPYTANACLAGKTKCVIKLKGCLLGCYGKGAGGGVAADPACLDKCRNGFQGDDATAGKGCVDKLDTKLGATCGVTQGEVPNARLRVKVQAHAEDLYRSLSPGGVNPANKCTAGKIKCVLKFNACVLGILGKAYKAGGPLGDLSKCNAILSDVGGKASCMTKLELKGGCVTSQDQGQLKTADEQFVNEVISDFANAPQNLNNRRCVSDTSTQCTSDGDCSGGAGDCQYFFGAPLPLAAGGVASCVTSQWNGAITGTFNRESGASGGTAKVISRVYTGGNTIDAPCPKCVGDGLINDGTAGGTCSAGARSGLACDANGESPVPSFGRTSLDCPPPGGTQVASLPIDLSNTNSGTVTRTLTASSPNCNGLPGSKCMCSSCSLNSSVPCFTDADCAAASAGTCTNNAGEPRKPNACLDDTNGVDCSTTAGGDGECGGGPFDQHCIIEDFRQCTTNGDCPATGDACGGSPRRCIAGYLGAVNDTIKAVGSFSTPHNQASTSTFASVFCVAPTSSSAVNAAAGLPGPGRLELGGVGLENGTDAACPTQVSFLPTARGGALDTGWTGLAQNAKVVGQGMVTVSASCPGAAPNCGTCTYTGPIANP